METIDKEVSDALHMLLHCALKDKEFETQKGQFHIVYDYIQKLENELEKKDKVIDEMAELIVRKTGSRIEICHNMNCDKTIEKECKYCAKEYFYNRIEEK